MRLYRVFFATIIILLHTIYAETYKLDSVVTTGSTLETDIAKIPGNVSIVDNKQINTTTNGKIADIAKKLAGVRVSNDVGFNPRPSIKIRGINYGTLILLDGIILSDLEGEARILNQISLYDVKRVEIARGAYSSLYGAGAIGGVVNFITAMPTKFEIEAIAGYGNEIMKDSAEKNLTRLYFSIGNAFKKLRVKLSAGMNTSQGYASTPAYLTQEQATTANISGGYVDKAGRYIIGDIGRREWQSWDTRLKLEYDISDEDTIKAMLSASSHSYEFVSPTSLIRDSSGNPTFSVPDSSNSNSTSLNNQFIGSGYDGYGTYTHLIGNLSYLHYFDDAELKLSLSSVNLLSRWIDAITGSANFAGGAGWTQDINTSSNYLDILYHTYFNEKHALSSALQFRYLNFVQENHTVENWRDKNSVLDEAYGGYGGQAFVASVYVNWDAQWLSTLSTSLGLRYDYWLDFKNYIFGLSDSNTTTSTISNNFNERHTNNFSPKFSINYIPLSWLTFKTSVGSGFRMSTLREKFRISTSANYWSFSPDLKNETAIAFEIGAEMKFKDYLVNIYYFQTELFDMIYRQGQGTQANPYKYVNAGYGRVNGIEISASIPIWHSLRLEGNYTWTLAKVLENSANPDSVGKQLVDVPEHMGNVMLNYGEERGFYGSLWAYFTSAFYNDDINSTVLSYTYGFYDAQFSLNVKLGYIFNNGFDLALSFLNITNNQYYDFYRVAGASFYVQLHYKL